MTIGFWFVGSIKFSFLNILIETPPPNIHIKCFLIFICARRYNFSYGGVGTMLNFNLIWICRNFNYNQLLLYTVDCCQQSAKDLKKCYNIFIHKYLYSPAAPPPTTPCNPYLSNDCVFACIIWFRSICRWGGFGGGGG